MIEFKDVCFSYDDGEELIKHVGFTIKSGEFVSILGSNGCGKTTLARLMNGLLLPCSGEVVVDGLSTSNEENSLKVLQKVGMIFQDPTRQLVASTVEDELAFGPENLGVDPQEIRQRINWSLRALNIEDLRYKEPHYLSGGQTQRVAIASVLVMYPQYIVMDEPTAMLDPRGRIDVLGAVDFLHRKLGISIIYVTHHMEEVLHSERVLVINDGQLAFDGSARELFLQDKLVDKLNLERPQIIRLIEMLNMKGYSLPYCDDWQILAENISQSLKERA